MALKPTVLALCLAAGAPAFAQEEPAAGATQEPRERCQEAAYRAFDFWLGEWTVTDPAGKLAGTNTITAEEGGCLILERWQGASGTTGQSYNFYNPVSGMWRQVWISPGAVIDYEGGLDQAGAMVLEGEIAYRNGEAYDFRGTWTPEEDGSVTQHFEQHNPETGEWDDWFTGIYRRDET